MPDLALARRAMGSAKCAHYEADVERYCHHGEHGKFRLTIEQYRRGCEQWEDRRGLSPPGHLSGVGAALPEETR